MRRIHLTIGIHVRALSDLTHASKVMGRLLLGLVAFLMMAMMWTERFMTWDRFLQGGQDLELSLVALVIFLCLIILLAQRSQQAMVVHLMLCRLLAGVAALAHSLYGSSVPGSRSLIACNTADGLPPRVLSFTSRSPLRI